jgi:hypothetical protein
VLATEGDEMETAGFLKTLETPRHRDSVARHLEQGPYVPSKSFNCSGNGKLIEEVKIPTLSHKTRQGWGSLES